MVRVAVTPYCYSVGWVGYLRIREREKAIQKLEVKTNNKISKERQKNKKWSLAKCIFIPSFMSNLATLQVPGPTKSQPAQHKKSLGFTYIWQALPNLKLEL